MNAVSAHFQELMGPKVYHHNHLQTTHLRTYYHDGALGENVVAHVQGILMTGLVGHPGDLCQENSYFQDSYVFWLSPLGEKVVLPAQETVELDEKEISTILDALVARQQRVHADRK